MKEEIQNKLEIETTRLIEAKSMGKIIEHKDKLIYVKVSSNDHNYYILNKTPSLKELWIFINKYLIIEVQDELKKEVQKVKETKKEGKWAIIRDGKTIIRDKD